MLGFDSRLPTSDSRPCFATLDLGLWTFGLWTLDYGMKTAFHPAGDVGLQDLTPKIDHPQRERLAKVFMV